MSQHDWLNAGHRTAYSKTQGNHALVCEYDVGLFPCSLSLTGECHFKSHLCSLDHKNIWEDNHALPKTIS